MNQEFKNHTCGFKDPYRLRVCQNRVICSLHQYYSRDKFEEDRVNETWGEYGEKRNAYRNLVVKPEGKKPLGRPRLRWKANITTDFIAAG